VAVPGINIRHDVAMARQAVLKGASSDQFQKTLKGALKEAVKTGANGVLDGMISQGKATSGSAARSTASVSGTDEKKLKGKLNEAMAVGFVAPMLADALGRFEQTYFANSPAEQAYARQLCTEIATRIGQSSKFPIARDIARAVLQRLSDAQRADTPSTDTQENVSS